MSKWGSSYFYGTLFSMFRWSGSDGNSNHFSFSAVLHLHSPVLYGRKSHYKRIHGFSQGSNLWLHPHRLQFRRRLSEFCEYGIHHLQSGLYSTLDCNNLPTTHQYCTGRYSTAVESKQMACPASLFNLICMVSIMVPVAGTLLVGIVHSAPGLSIQYIFPIQFGFPHWVQLLLMPDLVLHWIFQRELFVMFIILHLRQGERESPTWVYALR